MHDPVNHPSHYQGSIECIEAIEASMSREAFKGTLKGNILKYIWRYERKNGLEDLKKAQWYLERLIHTVQCEVDFANRIEKTVEEFLTANYDPDDYMASGCPDGSCPMPNVRQGPSESMFAPICDS